MTNLYTTRTASTYLREAGLDVSERQLRRMANKDWVCGPHSLYPYMPNHEWRFPQAYLDNYIREYSAAEPDDTLDWSIEIVLAIVALCWVIAYCLWG